MDYFAVQREGGAAGTVCGRYVSNNEIRCRRQHDSRDGRSTLIIGYQEPTQAMRSQCLGGKTIRWR